MKSDKYPETCGSIGPIGGCQKPEGHEGLHQHTDERTLRTRLWTSKEYDRARRRIPGANAV